MVYGIPLTIRAALHKTFLIMQNLLCYAENRKVPNVEIFVPVLYFPFSFRTSPLMILLRWGLDFSLDKEWKSILETFNNVQLLTITKYKFLAVSKIFVFLYMSQINFLKSILESNAVLKWGVQMLEFCAKKENTNFSEDLYTKIGLVLQIYDDYLNLHSAKVWKSFTVFKLCLNNFRFSTPLFVSSVTILTRENSPFL